MVFTQFNHNCNGGSWQQSFKCCVWACTRMDIHIVCTVHIWGSDVGSELFNTCTHTHTESPLKCLVWMCSSAQGQNMRTDSLIFPSPCSCWGLCTLDSHLTRRITVQSNQIRHVCMFSYCMCEHYKVHLNALCAVQRIWMCAWLWMFYESVSGYVKALVWLFTMCFC